MRWQGALVAALLVTQAAPALAERDSRSGAPVPPERKKKVATPSPITDHFAVEGIYYGFRISTGLRLDPPNPTVPGQLGTPVSAEGDLGLKQWLNQGRIEMTLRMRERSRVRVDYENVSRSASTILQKNIQFGNQLFLAGELADTTLSWRAFTLTYTYSLYRSDWLEIGTGIGVSLVQLRAIGQAQVLGVVAGVPQTEDLSAVSVFPTIPLDVTWRIAQRLAVVGRIQYLDANIGNFSGSLMDLHGDVQYRWTPNFAVGVGYTLERVAVQVSSSSFPGQLDLDTRGPVAFFRMSL
jgi:hypothetical protein